MRRIRPLATSSSACRSIWSLGTTATRHGVTAQRRRAPALVQQRQLPQDRSRTDLGHWLAVDLHLEHAVEQQEQLVTLLVLLDQGPAGLEPPELRLGIDDRD